MNEQSRSELRKWTLELIRLNKEAKLFYQNEARKEGYEPDFYGKVKPFTDEVTAIFNKWEQLASAFIMKDKPLHIHPAQIQQTKDNLEVVAIKSFYGNSSLKIQMETFKSVQYTLDQFLHALEKSEI